MKQFVVGLILLFAVSGDAYAQSALALHEKCAEGASDGLKTILRKLSMALVVTTTKNSINVLYGLIISFLKPNGSWYSCMMLSIGG
jgi:hypothetical protein